MADRNYFCIEPTNTSTATRFYFGTNTSVIGTLQYSTDNGQSWNNLSKYSWYTMSVGSRWLFRGTNPNGFFHSYSSYGKFTFLNGTVRLSGQLASLFDYNNIDNCILPNNACYSMFSGATVITSIDRHIFDGIVGLGTLALYMMFQSCTGLTSLPDLPEVDTLTNSCYYQMFRLCSNVTTGPKKIPGKNLAYRCCRAMFQSCGKLTNTPDMPEASSAAEECFYDMFDTCSSLTEWPKLKQTTLAKACYQEMFRNCTNLSNPPKDYLPATNLADYCYSSMFNGCKKLTEILDLPATKLAPYCYNSMYAYTNIPEVPDFPERTLAAGCYNSMFAHCPNITKAPALPNTTLAENCYYGMFLYTNITEMPDLPAETLMPYCYAYMFDNCTKLTEVPPFKAKKLADSCFYYMFNGCTGLTEMPDLPYEQLYASCYSNMFNQCSNIKHMKQLPAKVVPDNAYTSMFANSGIITAEDILCEQIDMYGATFMFQNCQFETAPKFPNLRILSDNSLCYTFSNCTNLKKGIDVKVEQFTATPYGSDATSTFSGTYYGCTALEDSGVIEIPASFSSDNYYMFEYMFFDCPNLTKISYMCNSWDSPPSWGGGRPDWVGPDIPSSGTFNCLKGLPITYTNSTVPVGWTVNQVQGIKINDKFVIDFYVNDKKVDVVTR